MNQSLRYFLSLCLCTALGASLLHGLDKAPSTKVQLASDVWPPLTDQFGKPRLAIEIVHLALARIGYDPDTQILDSWTVPEDLKADKYDGCGVIWKSEDRESYLLFSKPYLESRLYLVGQKGSDVSATDLSELKGKRVALVKGYAYGSLVDGAEGIEIVYGSNEVENLKMVKAGKADYTLVEDLLIQHAQKEFPEETEKFLEFGQKSLLTKPLHLALRKNLPNASEIIAKFDKMIPLMQADGTYNRVLRLNSIAIDIDNDGVKELVLVDINPKIGAITGGYSVYTNDKALPEKKRYSIRNTLYDDWNSVPDDYRGTDDLIPDTRMEGFNLFGGDF